jgi:drug/metabolite transporter (DMT)-like permease
MSAAELAGGIALAAGAACCFDGAVALQALEARALPVGAVGTGLLRALLARPRWLAATGLAILGWPLQVAALELAPLTVVQPTLAVGLVLLLVLGVRLLGEPAGPSDLLGCAAIAAGLALLAWAAPERSTGHAGTVALVAVLGGLGLIALAPWLLGRRAPGGAMVAAAGCGYAASGLTSKLLADGLAAGDLATVAGWGAATIVVAGTALADEMGALQRVGAARVAAGAFALQIVVPVLGAPLLTGEPWSSTPLHGAVIVAGVVLVVGGSLALGTGKAVSRLVTASHAPEP